MTFIIQSSWEASYFQGEKQMDVSQQAAAAAAVCWETSITQYSEKNFGI
jgi:hypothetical protein